MGLTFLSEIATRVLAYAIKNSFPVYYVFAPIQLILLCLVLYRLVNKKIALLLGFVGILIDIGIIIREPFFRKFPSHLLMANSIIITFLSLYGVYSFLNIRSSHSLFKQSWFWFSIGNILFFTSTFLFFSLINFLQKQLHVPDFIYSALWFIALILYTCYFLALYTNVKYKTPLLASA